MDARRHVVEACPRERVVEIGEAGEDTGEEEHPALDVGWLRACRRDEPKRALDLPEHGGQVSFPGGRIEPGDEGPADAALRETEEEIGLQRRFVKIVGYLDSYPTISGYSVSPVVGFVEPGFDLIPDRVEVDSVFEVPLAFLLDPANHKERHEVLAGTRTAYYEITYRCRRIWGVTAGILVSLYQKIKI